MPRIHPTAVVDPAAQIADDAQVGPLCHVGPHVTIDAGTRLVSHVAVLGHTTIGKHNTLWPGAVIGGDPQDLKFRGEVSYLVVGDHNDIRECVTMSCGTANGGLHTRVGDDNLIMAYTHVGHDCVIGSHVILSNAVQLAGHIHVQDHANVGGATALHHYVTVGQYAFVGGMTRVVHDAPPFMIVEGNPASVRALNTIGLRRHNFDAQSIERLKIAFRLLYRGGAVDPGSDQSAVPAVSDSLAKLQAQFPDDECIRILVDFTRRSMIGSFGRFRESQRPDDRFQNPVR